MNPYGVNPERFSGAKPADNGPIFLAVGRFVEKKAPYLTLLAFSKVVKEAPSSQLIMVGGGPLLGICRKLIEPLGLKDSVELLGPQPTEKIEQLMRQARAFVQHSLEADNGDSEGTPVAVIEAQMSGLPVIATRHAGIPDVVLDGVTGFLVEEGDVEGMASQMVRLAKDPVLAGRLGNSARRSALENFTLDRHIRELSEMIAEGCRRV